ncbi:unnamed protein product [Lepeophtheirus salmonis]|uniref:(salmon louse) hypothetical protein n=1 Tax=Lepeophtheirus salmonis TaxID=72036 RepID=A0A7R8CS43_LEPSM|nr:unnamed protein product [Lepeophtheirus salmonis]CAF2913528.1 unnamed protein product [Lepeophtheirus salmonis]
MDKNGYHRPHKVTADKSSKQVGQTTAAERGIMLKLIGAFSDEGTFIPPMIIFPRVHFKDFILTSALVGIVGAVKPNTGSDILVSLNDSSGDVLDIEREDGKETAE